MNVYGLPMAEYEILISEIIKGDESLLGAQTLVIRILESEDAEKVFEWLQEFREGEHLMFLSHNPDNTFAIRGTMFDMKEVNGGYYFRDLESYKSAFGSQNKEIFIEDVRELAESVERN